MNAHDRLRRGQTLALEGRYEEALADYQWFHENAVVEDPALRGVRRSFALAYWVELGAVFPPARDALISVRNMKRNALMEQTEEAGFFADVAAINHYLEDQPDTYQLFLAIHRSAPAVAGKYIDAAMPAIVGSQDYVLARSYISNPESALAYLLNDFNDSVDRANTVSDKRRRKSRLDAYTTNFAADINLLLEVVQHTDGEEYRAKLYRMSISGVSTSAIRKRVSRKLAV